MSFRSYVKGLVSAAWPGQGSLPWLGARINAGGASFAPAALSAQGALSLTAVFRACSLLADAASTQPPALYKREATGGRKQVQSSAAARALATLTQSDSEMFAFSCALTGNGYLRIIRDQTGAPFELRAIPSWRVLVEIEAGTGRVWYRVAPDLALEEQAAMLPEADVIHAKYRTTGANRLLGVPPMVACAPSFALALQSREVQRTLFSNLSYPSGVLSAPGKVDKEVARQLQQQWAENYSGAGLGKVAVLSNGLDYKSIVFNAVDAQLLESIKASTADIARAYSVPRQFLEDVDHATFASAVEGTRALYALTLRSFSARLADAMGQRLLTRNDRAAGATIEFDLTSLLLLPGSEQAEFMSKLVNAGIASVNECRNTYLSLPDVEGGDTLRAPVNTAPLDRWALGNSTATPAAEAKYHAQLTAWHSAIEEVARELAVEGVLPPGLEPATFARTVAVLEHRERHPEEPFDEFAK